jgi:Ca2+-binding EF-hand superfamily protein
MFEVLKVIIPQQSAHEGNSLTQSDLVVNEIRKYFKKHDTEKRGSVTEERFRSFCRRSGLLEKLTVSELRRLIEKLKKKWIKDKSSVIDYEKFCHHLAGGVDSIPFSRSEDSLVKLKNAVTKSSLSGRPFLSLCSLVDPRLTGVITVQELVHIAKMMDCVLLNSDVDAIKSIVPEAFKDRSGTTIDYRELNFVLQSYTPRSDRGMDRSFAGAGNFPFETMREKEPFRDLNLTNRSLGALPSYASPWGGNLGSTQGGNIGGGSTTIPRGRGGLDLSASRPMSASMYTPAGFPLNNMIPPVDVGGRGGFDRSLGGFEERERGFDRGADRGKDPLYMRILMGIADKVTVAVTERGRNSGSPFSLLKHFEVYDNGHGLIAERPFEGTLDAFGVSLSASDLHVLYERFGRSEDDKVDYQAFCFFIEDCNRSLSASYENEKLSLHNPQKSSVQVSEYDGLRNSYNGTYRTQYENPSSRDKRNLEIDPVLDPTNVDQWLANEASPKQRTDFTNVYDSLHKFKAAIDPRGIQSDSRSELDGFPYGFGGLLAPKVTDSISSVGGYSRPPLGRMPSHSTQWYRGQRESLDNSPRSPSKPYVGRSGYMYNSEENYPTSLTRNLSPTRGRGSTSPSRVGSLMWGTDTPLDKKGKIPSSHTTGNNWCCAVCLYVENPSNAEQCSVCDSPNYTRNKDFQVKEQCRNCTFLNGQFSRECEMCGEPLSAGGKGKEKERILY